MKKLLLGISLFSVAFGTSSAAATCPSLLRPLSLGSRGEDVKTLQSFFISEGLLTIASPTTYFGSLTENAVKNWQLRNKIAVPGDAGYGFVGPKTRAALAACKVTTNPVGNPAPTTPAPITSPTSPTLPSTPVATNPTTPSPVYTPTTPPGTISPQATTSPVTVPTPTTPSAPYTLSSPTLVANRERTPLGQSYKDGTIVLQAGTQKKVWNGASWITPSNQGSYTQGSMHATVSLPDNSMFAFDFSTSTRFDGEKLKWASQYLRYASPLGALTQAGDFFVNVLPGDSIGEMYEPLTLVASDNYIYMALQRLVYRTEPWTRADGQAGTGYGYRCESYMTRSLANDPINFTFMGTIGTKDHYSSALQSSNLSFPEIPLYYACAPRCIALSDTKLVCALRGSADDDDGFRPLDPAKVLHTPTDTAQTGSFDSNKIAPGIYAPALLPNKYYVPKNTAAIPPLLITTSDNGGVSWERKFIATRGGVDAHFAYDKANNVLMLAYGGLTYPRKGVVAQWSYDGGTTWSAPLTLSDGYTTGTAFVAHTGPKQFEIVYDSLDRYIEFNAATKAQIDDGYKIYSRTLKVQ